MARAESAGTGAGGHPAIRLARGGTGGTLVGCVFHAEKFRMSDAHHPQRSRAILMLLFANLFWGLSFPVIKAVMLLHGVLIPQLKHRV